MALRYSTIMWRGALLACAVIACGDGRSIPADATPPDSTEPAPDGTSPDSTVPTAMITPGNGLLLPAVGEIVIWFSESIDPATVMLGGVLAAESGDGVWSATTSANDTLTLRPKTSWTVGFGLTLTTDARDPAGNAMATLETAFDVAAGTFYYVNATAVDDTDDGLTPATAKQTIQAAVAAATPPAAVLVAQGSYPVTSGTATEIVLRDTVSLYGGHAADFTARNPAVHTSTVADQATTGGTFDAPNCAIRAGTGITPATVVHGLTVLAGGGGNSSAILLVQDTDAHLTIRSNTIVGGTASVEGHGITVRGGTQAVIVDNTVRGGMGGQWGMGVHIRGGVTLTGNSIHGGGGTQRSSAVMVQSNQDGAATTIIGNRLYGGDGPGLSVGIDYNGNPGVTIRNNTIHGGAGGGSVGINAGNTWGTAAPAVIENNSIDAGNAASTPVRAILLEQSLDGTPRTVYIRNNLMFSSAASSTCILEAPAAATPTEVRNNNLLCTTAYREFDAGCGGTTSCTLAQLEALTDIPGGASGNITVDPMFVDVDGADDDPTTMSDNDWRLTGMSPLNLRGGGRALTGFGDDADGIARTTDMPAGMTNADAAGWSIGAYERD